MLTAQIINGKGIYLNGKMITVERLKASKPVTGSYLVRFPAAGEYEASQGVYNFRDGVATRVEPFPADYPINSKLTIEEYKY